MSTDLEKSLLYQIMQKLGTLREETIVTTSDLFELVEHRKEQLGGEQKAFSFLSRHLAFLGEMGYVKLGTGTLSTGDRMLSLTAKGQMFVQPELAEFANESLLPDTIKALERRIETSLTYPEEEKNGLLYKVRRAVAEKSSEVLAKVIVEVGSRLGSGS
jgi:hypothetical protein